MNNTAMQCVNGILNNNLFRLWVGVALVNICLNSKYQGYLPVLMLTRSAFYC